MLLLNRTADALPEPGAPELDRINQEYAVAVEAMGRAGVLIDCAPLGARPRAGPGLPVVHRQAHAGNPECF